MKREEIGIYLAKKIMTERKKRKISRRILAEWLDISEISLYRYEKGEREMPISVFIAAMVYFEFFFTR